MGTWDIGFFDNDMACDWENGITKNQNLSYIKNALLPVIEGKEDTLDIAEASRALAAAESLARLLGYGSEKNSYTKHIDYWAAAFDEEIPDSLIKLAIGSLEKVLGMDSEIRQYWTIRGEIKNWEKSIIELKERLLTNHNKKFPSKS